MATSIGFDIYAKDRASGPMGRVGSSADRLDGKMRRIHAAGMLGSRGFDAMARGAAKATKVVGLGLATGVAAGALAVAGLTHWVGEGSESLMRIQTIGAQTDAVIRSTAGAANVSRKEVDRLAGSLEGLTGVEAESITQGQNMLLTFTNVQNRAGKGNAIFNQATRIMTDFSVATGKDTVGAATMMGKALNDPIRGVTALSKVGVTFTSAQREQIKALVEGGKTMSAQKIILAELKKEFGGSAAAFGATDVGKIERFKHAIGTLQETVASAFAPAVGRVATLLVDKGVPAVTRWGDAFNAHAVPAIRRQIREVRALWAIFQANGLDGVVTRVEELTGTQGRLTPVLAKVRAVGGDLADIFTNSLVPAFSRGAGVLPALGVAGRVVASALGFLANHADATRVGILAVVAVLTLAKVGMLAYAGYTKAAAAATAVHTAAVAVSTSTFGTRVGVMALDAAAWLRSTASTAASTVATGVNTAATRLSSLSLGTRLGLLAGSAATWAAATAATAANTVVTVGWSLASKAAALATTGVAAAQWALNAAMYANPVGLVVLAIGALVVAAVVAYRKVGWFRDGVNAAFRGVVAAGRLLVKFFLNFTLPGLIIKHWGTIRRGTVAAWGAVTGFVRGIPRMLVSAFLNFTLPGLMIKHWSSIRRGAGQKLGDLVNYVRGIPGRIVSAVGNLGSLLYNAGIAVVQGLINGIKAKAGELMGLAGSLAGSIKKKIGSALKINSPSRVTFAQGQFVVDGLIGGMASRTVALGRSAHAVGGAVARGAASSAKKGQAVLSAAGAGLLAGLVKGIRSKRRSAESVMDAVGSNLERKVEKWKSILATQADFAGGFKDFSTSIFASENGDEAPTLASMKAHAMSQRGAAEQGNRDVQRLLKLGLSKDLIRQLQAQGPSGIAQLHALASGSKDDVDWFNRQNAATNSQWGSAGKAAAEAIWGDDRRAADRDKRQAEALAKAVGEAVDGMASKFEFELRGTTLVATLKKVKRDQGGKKLGLD